MLYSLSYYCTVSIGKWYKSKGGERLSDAGRQGTACAPSKQLFYCIVSNGKAYNQIRRRFIDCVRPYRGKRLLSRKPISRTNRAAALLPTVNTPIAFSRLAKNDLPSHLEYLESVRSFHVKVRDFFPYIFQNAKVEQVNGQNVPRHDFDGAKQASAFPISVSLILIFAALLLIAARRNFTKKVK